MIDHLKILDLAPIFKEAKPFSYAVIDNFFSEDLADSLESEFPDYESDVWHVYKNQIEDKKTINDWNKFGGVTYRCFNYLNSPDFVNVLSRFSATNLMSDPGLNGGGWHIHGNGGNLNPHLDYSIHPKLKKQRKLNIIIYLSRNLKSEHGGQLGLWEHDVKNNAPGKLSYEVDPKFNRAIIFDTTQNSWHGMSRMLKTPDGIFRKSLAVYYLCEPPENTDPRGKALFAPREEQKNDTEVADLIKKRSQVSSASSVYVKK
jgi:2OG-Fe(II) oxygenase superfamily